MSSAISFQARLRDRLASTPDGRALAFVDGRGDFEWLSFGDFYQEAARAGHALSESGVRAGDSCVFVLASDRACAATVLGSLLIGAVPTLCAPPVVRGLHSNLPEVVRHVAGKTGARLIILGEESASLVPALEESGFSLAQVGALTSSGDADAAPLADPDADAIIAMQLTSGTTGLPKVCVWKQHRVLASLDGMVAAMGLDGSADTFVNWTPLYHDMGLVNNFLLCLAHGIPLAWLQASDFVKRPAGWLRAMHHTDATTTWSPNFGFAMTAQRVTDAEMEGIRLDHVRGFWNAAERIHAESILQFRDRFAPYGLAPHAVKTNFGCAENVGGATFSSVNAPPVIERIDRRALHDEGIARLAEASADDATLIVSTGAPYPGMTIRIVGENGETLPEGHVGAVALCTPSRMIGYLDEPEETATALRGDELFTGDVGYLRDGELFWTGRVRERINLNGKKYDPSDFEGVLFEVEGLREGCFAAFGIDDAAIGSQRLVIVSEIRAAAERAYDEILRDIRRRVSTRMNVSVSEILLLPQGAMSKTSSGKRRHRFYRELHLSDALDPVAAWRE